ncbi:MAG: DUF6064 family protein [Promethearchaeota archaeon]
MYETSELRDLLNEIGEINEAIFPGHLIIGIFVILITLWCYLRPNKTSDKLMKGFLAVYYAIIVYTCIVCALNMKSPYYFLTVVVHLAVCLFFMLSIFNDEIKFGLPEQNGIKFLSVFMTIYGIFLYPLVEIFMGYVWPKIFVFSFCPMGIFAIGIVITAYPEISGSKIHQTLLVLLSFGAVVFGARTVLIGGIFDLSYIISGIIGFLIFLRYEKNIQFLGKRKRAVNFGDIIG